MIELAATVWKLDLTACLVRLSLAGTIPAEYSAEQPLRDYERAISNYRAMYDFWSAASGDLLEHPDELSEYRLSLLLDTPEQRAAASNWVGVATPAMFEQLRRRLCRESKLLELIGRRNKPALVIPYYDGPAHLCGVELYDTVQGSPRKVYVPLSATAPIYGLTQLDASLSPPRYELGNDLFIATSALTALQIQLQWRKSHGTTLPLVAAHEQTDGVWHGFARRLIVWSDSVTIPSLAIAQRANAHFVASALTDLKRHISQPLDWLRYFQDHAKLWSYAVSEYLDEVSDSLALQVLFGLGMSATTRTTFIQNNRPRLRRRMLKLLVDTANNLQVVVRGKTITSRPDGWYIGGQAERICNGTIRLEQVVTTDAGKSYYRGTVTVDNHTFPLLENLEHVQKDGLFARVAKAALLYGCQFQYSARWNRDAEFIAQQFGQPEIVRGVSRVGWDPWAKNFRFPLFVLSLSGRASTDQSGMFVDPQLPCRNVRPPGILLQTELNTLTSLPSGSARLLWATLACVVHNALASPLHFKSNAVAVQTGPKEASRVFALAERFGCTYADYRRGAKTQASFLKELSAHAWPRLVPDNSEAAAYVQAEGANNCFARLNWLQAKAANGWLGWHVLSPPIFADYAEWPAAVDKLLPAYLQWLCRRNLVLPTQSKLPLLNVLQSLQDWASTLHNSSFDFNGAAELLAPAGGLEAHEAFVDIVHRLYGADYSGLTRPGMTKDVVIVDAPAVQRAVLHHNGPGLDFTAIGHSLEIAHKGFYDITDQCMVIDAGWWRTRCRLIEATDTHTLRLVQ